VTLWRELSWSHYRLLIRIEDDARHEFYGRLLATEKSGRDNVKNAIRTLEPKTEPDYILKDPYVLEFLDLKGNKNYLESELEQALIDKLQNFLLELGKGFSFVARQKRIDGKILCVG
jgi:predicted nuclease of restriction endonuclease-like (RecB) superfamily